MYKGKKVLAFIPARKGSKRIKNKNMYMIKGKPLFQYSVETALNSKYIDDVFVSTDSSEILDLSIKLGCLEHGLREEFLSGDKARIIDAMIYEIKDNKRFDDYSAIVLLQPTSPYRTVELLDDAIDEYFKSETSLITVYETSENPLFIRRIVDGKLEKIITDSSDIRSQDFPKFYKIVGCIYINNIKDLNSNTVLNENKVPFVIDSKLVIDIDEYSDLEKVFEVL